MKTAIESQIKEILNINREELYENDRLGKLSFGRNEEEKKDFELMFEIFEDIQKCNLNRIPSENLNTISSWAVFFKDYIDRALKIDIESTADIQNEKNAIVSKIRSQYSHCFNELAPIISFSTKLGTDLKEAKKYSDKLIKEIQDNAKEFQKQLEKNKTESNKIIDSMRTIAAEAGVSQNSIYYSNAEKKHAALAKKWLNFSIGTFSVLLAYTIACTYHLSTDYSGIIPSLGYIEIGITACFFLLVYVLYFFVKQYNSNQHLAVTNGDKSKALSTFKTFVDAADNEDVKDVILQQASYTIFSLPPSGYLKNQESVTSILPSVALARKLRDNTLGDK